ncbi:MAG: hypothetical protein WCJ14_12775 [Verrucomicrobiota bacterium]
MKFKTSDPSAFIQPCHRLPWLGLAAALLLGGTPAAFGTGVPLVFLANGTLAHLRVGGSDILRQTNQRCGFSALWFDGSRVKEIACEKVTFDHDRLRVIWPNGFPRLEFTLKETSGQVLLDLVRVEGMPRGRDASICFRATLAPSARVAATGTGVEVVSGPAEVRAYWTSLGRPKPQGPAGGISIRTQL